MARNNSFKGFKKVSVESREVKQLQENVEQFAKPILNCPLIDGVLIKNICLQPSSPLDIKHKLGRKPTGWILTRKRQDARIWDLQETNPKSSQTLTLASSHFCQVDIWIF